MHRLDIGYIHELANRIFSSPEQVSDWLNHPSVQLGGRTPMEVLETEDGVRRVEELLTQIDDDDRLGFISTRKP